MIDRVALAALPPERRAALIYSEAQAALSKRLWQAALGSGDRGERSDAISDFAMPTQRTSDLDALIAAFTEAQAPPQRQEAAPKMQPAVYYTERAVAPEAPKLPAPSTDNLPATITGLGVNARYRATLEAAAARTGIPASALAAIVDAEAAKSRDGSWQIFSRNPRSSAAGLGQFLSRTWEGMAQAKGTWLNQFAQERGWIDAGGAVAPGARSALLAARYDPTASINGIADYARRNLDGLARAGVVADGDTRGTARLAYLGHHLGLGDAVRFLRDGGLGEARARKLLGAQIGAGDSTRRIAASGDARGAHREWMLGYLDRKVRPDRFAEFSS